MNPVLDPIIQYGFAGFCAVLLVMNWFQNKRTMDRLETVIENNTKMLARFEPVIQKMDDIRDRLLERPCLCEDK